MKKYKMTDEDIADMPPEVRKLTIGQKVPVVHKGKVIQALFIGWKASYHTAVVEIHGHSHHKKIKWNETPVAVSRIGNAPIKQSRFDVNERFDFIKDVTNMVVTGESNSVIVSGSGGLGKTFTVLACLKAAELEEIDNGEGDYEVVKGFVTPKALYRLLYNNRDGLLVFDDCDSVWDNPTTVSLLKAALDSYETRHISWFSESRSEEDDLPQRFEFKGKIIFVSNLSLLELDQAVLSRCLYVDVSMTPVEKIKRIRALRDAIRPDMNAKAKDEVIDLIAKHAENVGDLNIRTFLKVCEIRHANEKNWRDLAEYVITAL